MFTQSETERDVAAWLESNPTEANPADYPKLMYNVNLPPQLVRNAEQEGNMGKAWRPLNIAVPDVPAVSLYPETAAVPAAGGTGSFHVTITGPGASGEWTAEKDAAADWLLVTPDTPQGSDGDVTYTADPNLDVERTANVYVNGKTFILTQAGAI
jgi:hypothetical protein